jgi:hypothetical protein
VDILSISSHRNSNCCMFDLRSQTSHQKPVGIRHASSVTHLRQVDDHLLIAEGLNNTVCSLLILLNIARHV